MATFVITGGAGFIGANLVHYALAHSSARIVVIDKMTYAANPRTIETWAKDERVTFVKADIADRAVIEQIFAAHPPSAILNLAAETHVDRSIDSPQPFIDTNVTGTFVLLEVARKYVAALRDDERAVFRFLHVSTDEV